MEIVIHKSYGKLSLHHSLLKKKKMLLNFVTYCEIKILLYLSFYLHLILGALLDFLILHFSD